MHPFQLPFSLLFCTFFELFPEKSQKGSKVRTQSLKKTPKWDPKGGQMEPRGHKVKLQGSQKCKKSATCTPRDSKWSPRCHIGAPRSPQMQNTQKTHPNCKKTHQKVAQGAKQRRKTIYPQPTNQRKKEGHKETNNRTNTHTRTRASNCKHKLKLPRPGARRRRRRSGRGFSERTL
jgi:hypothetical protein